MNSTVYELLFSAGFGLAAAGVGTLATIGLLVWLAGCRLPTPRQRLRSGFHDIRR